MILTGNKIQEEVESNKITIKPFNNNQLSPNSYDFRLGDTLLVYKNSVLDPKKNNDYEFFKIPNDGYVLNPDTLYLGHTQEFMGSNQYVPIIRGRSSIGRIGIFINITADLIDVGSFGQWTLQLHVTQPVKVYRDMLIGQITFWKVQGEIDLYSGKYQNSLGPRPSEMFRDFAKEKQPIY